mmetsp:Transcript_104227/g.301533  ORF Transcript_104227/g.301533 Transcript_104227/m.301533 type:complete len:330 (-) Transcript_104227:521-1510(-)
MPLSWSLTFGTTFRNVSTKAASRGATSARSPTLAPPAAPSASAKLSMPARHREASRSSRRKRRHRQSSSVDASKAPSAVVASWASAGCECGDSMMPVRHDARPSLRRSCCRSSSCAISHKLSNFSATSILSSWRMRWPSKSRISARSSFARASDSRRSNRLHRSCSSKVSTKAREDRSRSSCASTRPWSSCSSVSRLRICPHTSVNRISSASMDLPMSAAAAADAAPSAAGAGVASDGDAPSMRAPKARSWRLFRSTSLKRASSTAMPSVVSPAGPRRSSTKPSKRCIRPQSFRKDSPLVEQARLAPSLVFNKAWSRSSNLAFTSSSMA